MISGIKHGRAGLSLNIDLRHRRGTLFNAVHSVFYVPLECTASRPPRTGVP
jgi:hypothetical protein